jgi:L-fuconolactonase
VSFLESYTKYPLVKGIRRLLQSEAAGFMRQPKFIQGVRLLTRYNLSFDICIRHYQFDEAIALVQECPDVKFVLDHLGKPNIAQQQYEPWRKQIQQLAAFENVYVKISGLVTEADHQNWTPADLKLFIDHTVEVFGVHRVMFGSDWPVCTLAASYQQWLTALLQLTEHFTDDEKRLLFVENARNFYRIT